MDVLITDVVVALQFYHATKILLALHRTPAPILNDAIEFNKSLEVRPALHVQTLNQDNE